MLARPAMRAATDVKTMFWTAACVLVAATGCSHNVYELELKAGPAGLERGLTCWRKSGNDIASMSEDDLKRIAALYQATVEPPYDRKHEFQGTFSGKLPEDVGGAGYFTRAEVPFGTSYIYQERFRGDIDAVAALARREAAADELTNLAIGWSEQELGREPGFAQLRDFLDTEFRQDVKNIGLQLWFSALESDPNAPMRAAQYLTERGYGSPAEILAIIKGVSSSDEMNDAVPRFIAGKLGIDAGAPLPESFAFLQSSDALQESADRFLRTTEEFKRRHAAWVKLKETTPDAAEPGPGDMLYEIVGRAFFSGKTLQSSDELSVKLQTGVKPYSTNGTWRESAHQVVWSEHIEGADGPAAFCYALWSEPNRDAQRERFGQVLLDGEDLATYIDWYGRLTAERQKAWDSFISTLKPGLGLEARIANFRFADDPQSPRPDEQLKSAADPARELLLKRLLPQQ